MTLDPNSRPCRIAGVQIHSLADGRLLIRHPRDTSVRPTMDAADLKCLLQVVDGARSVSEIVAMA